MLVAILDKKKLTLELFTFAMNFTIFRFDIDTMKYCLCTKESYAFAQQ